MRRPVLEEGIVDLGRLQSIRGIGSEEGRDLAAVEARALVVAVEGGAHRRHLPDRGEALRPRRPPGAVGPDAAQIGLDAAGRVAVSHSEHPADGGGFAGEARVEERWRRGIDRLEDELHLAAAAAGRAVRPPGEVGSRIVEKQTRLPAAGLKSGRDWQKFHSMWV